ncbi:MAG: DUF1570 domain-containing protein [Planctomycetaceae bacterium]
MLGRPIDLFATATCSLWVRTIAGLVLLSTGLGAKAVSVTFVDDAETQQTAIGTIVVEAQDGGLVLLLRDGQLLNLTPKRIQSRKPLVEPFQPLSTAELSQRLASEFGAGFQVVTTQHYVLCTNAGPHYARWCGALLERLLKSLNTHWRAARLKLHKPQFPLTAIIFSNAQQFANHAAKDIGPGSAGVRGYYSIPSNRIVLYDLTERSGQRAQSAAEIVRSVSRAPFNVATVVHEATHQIAFNNGLHVRFADNPLWLTEGMAMYFETPDLKNRTGWRTVGKINPFRIGLFRKFASQRRGPASLSSLLRTDERFTQAESAGDAYAEAWALNYFLIKSRRKQYEQYLRLMQSKQPLDFGEPSQRLTEFQTIFGDLETLDKQFVSYMRRQR